AVGDHLDDGSFIGAVEPDAVDQIWGADLGISLGGVAVAGGAIVGEQLLAGGKIGADRHRQARERAYVARDRDDLVALEHGVLAEADHGALAPLGMARADAVGDRLINLIEAAAPQPVVVVEIGIALGSPAAGAVAGRAVVAERRSPLRGGEGEQRRVAL